MKKYAIDSNELDNCSKSNKGSKIVRKLPKMRKIISPFL